MNRRDFLGRLAGLATACALPSLAQGSVAKVSKKTYSPILSWTQTCEITLMAAGVHVIRTTGFVQFSKQASVADAYAHLKEAFSNIVPNNYRRTSASFKINPDGLTLGYETFDVEQPVKEAA